MSINILNEIQNDFLIYAKEVNQNRAFPDVRDGLKPSQRAALWEMFCRNYSSDKPHVKSAKITGGIIANWWPHGDSSAYESIVRMSQPWIENLCEIDWHGANGSLLGGPEAASSRYTECRLSKLSEDGFFSNIKKDTVDTIKNFSEDDEWPVVFPSIFPRLIVNGSQGIGYTIAQEWEPSNLIEFSEQVKGYLKNGKIDCNSIYPDYPTGGVIINKKDIHTIYETGKGSIILRAKAEINDNIIKITELPYQVYAEPLIQKIKDLVNNEQITGIEDIWNKSDDNGLLIEIECIGDKDDASIVLNKLYKLTDLQCTFNANQMALLNGEPAILTLHDYIREYVNHNTNCIKREYTFIKNKAVARLEIVDGLVRALSEIDGVIKIIKSSKSSIDASNNLIQKYGFTESQAKAIVDMKLGKLANLETSDLKDEQVSLTSTIERCDLILTSEAKLKKEFVKRLDDFVNKYGWERRTQLDDVDIVHEKAIVKASKTATEQQFMVALTKGNNIKRIKLTDYRPQAKIKNESDSIINAVKVSSKDKVILIGESGLMYKLQTNKIAVGSMTSTGESLNDIFNDRIIALFSGTESEEFIFFITNNGLVKKMVAKDVYSIGKNIGATVIKLDSDDKLIYCQNINDGVMEVKTTKKPAKLDTSKFKTKGRMAGGVKGIKLKDGQRIIVD